MNFVYAILALVVIASPSEAQDFSIPTTWQTNNSLSYDQRVSLVQAAIDNTWKSLNLATGMFSAQDNPQDPVLSGNPTNDFNAASYIWSSIAFMDGVTASSFYNAAVVNNLTLVAHLNPHFNSTDLNATFISIPLKWGIASMFAYRAYNDLSLLNLAQDVWNLGNQFAISTDDALNGSQASKNFSFHGTCGGVTTAGGVWTYQDPNLSTLDADTTSLFMLLSAYLSEASQNDTYTNAASLTANFVSNFFYSEGLIISNNIDIKSTPSSCPVTLPPDSQGLQQTLTAQYIEALSVLASTTSNTTYLSTLNIAVVAATNQSDWQDGDGGLRGGDNKASLIRSLYTAFSRNPSNTPLRNLVRSYVNVQYNTLLEHGTAPGSNTYAVNWEGPVEPYSTEGQRTALDLLVSAIGVNNNDTSRPNSTMSASPSATSPSAPMASHRKDVKGLAIGLPVAFVVCLVLGGVFLVRRRRRNPPNTPILDLLDAEEVPMLDVLDPDMVVTPFVEHLSTGPSSPRPPRKGARVQVLQSTPDRTATRRGSRPEATASLLSDPNNGRLPQAGGEHRNQSGGLLETLVRLLQQRLEATGDGRSERPPSYVS